MKLSILERLNGQRNSGIFCDVVLKFVHSQKSVYAHSCILAASSLVFHQLLEGLSLQEKSSDCKPKMIQLLVDDIFQGMEDILDDIVTYIYLGCSKNLSKEILMVLNKKLALFSEESSIAKEISVINDEVINKKEPIKKTKAKSTNVKMDVSFCNKCDLLFISEDEFLSHRLLNCTRKFTCQTCGSMFSKVQRLLEHLIEVRHGETTCSVCYHVTHSSQQMENHVQKHFSVKEKPYFCQQCESRFSTRYALSHHVPKHSVDTPFVCKVCSKGFKWKHALTSHMVTHSTYKKFLCQSCGFATSHASVFKNHQRIHSGQTMKCTLPSCKFETVRKQNLIQHQLTHSKERPHQCEVCGKSFSLVKNLRRHMRQHDFNATRHKCQVDNCDFSTLRKDKYSEHMKKHHPEVKTEMRNVFDIINPPNKTVDDVKEAGLDSDKPINSNILLQDVKLDNEELLFQEEINPVIDI